MFANDSNRAPFKERLRHAVISGFLFTLLIDAYDYFIKNEAFDWKLSLVSFLVFSLLMLGMNFLTLKKKEE